MKLMTFRKSMSDKAKVERVKMKYETLLSLISWDLKRNLNLIFLFLKIIIYKQNE